MYKRQTVNKSTQVRVKGGIKSPILKEVKKDDKITILDSGDKWDKAVSYTHLDVYKRQLYRKLPDSLKHAAYLTKCSVCSFHDILRI